LVDGNCRNGLVPRTFENVNIFPDIGINGRVLQFIVGINKIEVAGISHIMARIIPRARIEQLVIVVSTPHDPAQSDLLGVAHALNALRLELGSGQRWQEHCSQNRDNCDDDKQFNQGEAADYTSLFRSHFHDANPFTMGFFSKEYYQFKTYFQYL
jgi:hypothetical protein